MTPWSVRTPCTCLLSSPHSYWSLYLFPLLSHSCLPSHTKRLIGVFLILSTSNLISPTSLTSPTFLIMCLIVLTIPIASPFLQDGAVVFKSWVLSDPSHGHTIFRRQYSFQLEYQKVFTLMIQILMIQLFMINSFQCSLNFWHCISCLTNVSQPLTQLRKHPA